MILFVLHFTFALCLYLQDKSGFSVCRDDSSLAYTSLFLKQETESWDPKDNRIVQVTKQMADRIYPMTQYLRRKGPIAVMTPTLHCTLPMSHVMLNIIITIVVGNVYTISIVHPAY